MDGQPSPLELLLSMNRQELRQAAADSGHARRGIEPLMEARKGARFWTDPGYRARIGVPAKSGIHGNLDGVSRDILDGAKSNGSWRFRSTGIMFPYPAFSTNPALSTAYGILAPFYCGIINGLFVLTGPIFWDMSSARSGTLPINPESIRTSNGEEYKMLNHEQVPYPSSAHADLKSLVEAHTNPYDPARVAAYIDAMQGATREKIVDAEGTTIILKQDYPYAADLSMFFLGIAYMAKAMAGLTGKPELANPLMESATTAEWASGARALYSHSLK